MRKTGPTRETVARVLERDGYACRRCGHDPQQVHHRKPRGMGGTRDPRINACSNLVALCQVCHTYIEMNRAWARSEGWLVQQWADPETIPLVSRGRVLWLTDDGQAITKGMETA